MTKLIEILTSFAISANKIGLGESQHDKQQDLTNKAEQAIKAYIAEVIGQDEKLEDCPHNSFDWDSYCIRGKNELRAGQRGRAGL